MEPVQKSPAWTWSEVRERELQEVTRSRQLRSEAGPSTVAGVSDHLVGLGLSGGGIRSATFNLGILQALARAGLLRGFDYLSTVSGGGYIGSWLSAWIKRAGLDHVEACLAGRRGDETAGGESSHDDSSATREPDPIRFLREYSNYVTPRVGAFTGDTWAVVGIYLRNLLLNLVILIGVLGAVLAVPRLIVSGWTALAVLGHHSRTAVVWGSYLAALVLFIITATATQVSLNDLNRRGDVDWSVGWVYWLATLPFLLAALSLTVGMRSAPSLHLFSLPAKAAWPILAAVAHMVVWVIARSLASAVATAPTSPQRRRPGTYVWLLIGMLTCGAIGGALFWALGMAALQIDDRLTLWLMTIFGPPAVVVACLLASSLHTGFLGRDLSEDQREWLGRQGGLLLRHVCLWLIFFSAAAFGPLGLKEFLGWTRGGALWQSLTRVGVSATWIGTTLFGLVAGHSRSTGGPESGRGTHDRASAQSAALELVGRVAPHVFALGLIVLLSAGVDWLWARLGVSAPPLPHHATAIAKYINGLGVVPTRWTFIVLGAAVAFLALLIPRVDINEFSIHHLYRNRLIRCYLGASHEGRVPHPFTGFDPGDDLRMTDQTASAYQGNGNRPGPMHIINAALNLVGGSELAWQKRRAASFTFTPVASGYDYVKHRERPKVLRGSGARRKLEDAAYRRTGDYAAAGGGITLGTAMAISGAAASPNMGFHSSAPLAFLMTIFNVRLGWWAPNPRDRNAWNQAGPKFGLLYLLHELLGFSNDRSRNVYLSDGGHFENLGLYELVRRRCRTIVISDASQDGHYKYDDLTNAIQKCRVDFGADIQFEADGAPKRPEQTRDAGDWSFARANIAYADGSHGVLLYLKPSLTKLDASLTEDVRFYHAHNPAFPHQSTADQWFDETQFECYRQLGSTIGELHGQAIRDEIQKHCPLGADVVSADEPPSGPTATSSSAADQML